MVNKMDQQSELKPIACRLGENYCVLVPAVRQSLINHKVDLEGAKLMIKCCLQVETRPSPQLIEYINRLQKLHDFDSLFHFLTDNNFIGYLNYKLLKRLSQLIIPSDIDLMNKIDEYEQKYSELLGKASCANLLNLFKEWSDLSPTAPIGLPRVSFHLDKSWLDSLFIEWWRIYDKFAWSSKSFLKQLRKNCIIITYVILPSVLDDVMKDLSDPVILEILASKGVTVFELPQERKGELYIILL